MGSLHVVSPGSEIPPNAVRCSDEQIFQIQQKYIDSAKLTQMWPFKLGHYISSGLAAATGLYLSDHVKRFFKIERRFAVMVSYLGSSVVPAALTYVFYKHQTRKQLLGRLSCESCGTIRVGTMQVVLGLGYPLLMSHVTGLFTQRQHILSSLPSFETFREFFRFTFQPYSAGLFLRIGILQIVVVSFVFNMQYYYHRHKLIPAIAST